MKLAEWNDYENDSDGGPAEIRTQLELLFFADDLTVLVFTEL
jgi:hypothetical protein